MFGALCLRSAQMGAQGVRSDEKWREVMRAIYAALRSPPAIFAD